MVYSKCSTPYWKRPSGSTCCACITTAAFLARGSQFIPASFALFRLFPRLPFELPGRGRTHQSQTSCLRPRPFSSPPPGTGVGFRAHPSFPYARCARTSASDAVVALGVGSRLGRSRRPLGTRPNVLPQALPHPRTRSGGGDPCGGSGSCGRRRCFSCYRSSESESQRSALRPEP